MIISLAAGLAGAAGSTLVRQGGMAGMGSMRGGNPAQAGVSPMLVFLNNIAIPLLLVSIVLMLIGVARAGWRAVAAVALGSMLLVTNMFVPASTPVAAATMGAGYLLIILGYLAAWKITRARRTVLSRI
jgi:hypothetical protein